MGTSSRLRYAPPLAVTPIHRASVFVALAGIGGTPASNRRRKRYETAAPGDRVQSSTHETGDKQKDGVCGNQG